VEPWQASNQKGKYNNLANHTKLSDIYQIKAYGMDKKEVTTDLTQTGKYATLSFKYNDSDKIQPGSQNIFYYDTNSSTSSGQVDSKWKNNDLLNQTSNQDKLLVTTRTNHLTDYAVFADSKGKIALILDNKLNLVLLLSTVFLVSSFLTLLMYFRKRKHII